MIYIVEIPHQFRPTCWDADDKKDFCRPVRQSVECQSADATIYECVTAQELPAQFGYAKALLHKSWLVAIR